MGFTDLLNRLVDAPAGAMEVKAAFDQLCPACQHAAIKAALKMGKARVANCHNGKHAR